MKTRGNPNWGKPESSPAVPVVTEFEKAVDEYNLAPDQYLQSTELREWAQRNWKSKFIPEALLKVWGFELEAPDYEVSIKRKNRCKQLT